METLNSIFLKTLKKSMFLWLFIFTFLIIENNKSFGQTVTAIDGAVQADYGPMDLYYNYSYWQTIILQSEIATSGTISQISFEYDGNTAFDFSSIVVYLGHTSKTSFSSTSDWVSSASLTSSYTGSFVVSNASGWYTITLTTPFAYNNTDNLLIAIDNNTGEYSSSSSEFYSLVTAANRTLHFYSDITNANPATPPTADFRGANVPSVKLNFTAVSTANWVLTSNSNATVTGNVTATTGTLAGATDWGYDSDGWYGYNFPTADALSTSKYFQFTTSPAAGYDFTVTEVDLGGQDYDCDDNHFSVYYSLDDFSTSTQIGTQYTGGCYEINNKVISGLSILVPNGSTFKLRVYFYYVLSTGSAYAASIRGVSIKGTTVASTPSTNTDYFRSLATGNWNTAGTWQSSANNSTWQTSTLVPTSSATAITVQTGHTITINADVTASSITIAGTGIVTFDGVAARAVTVTGNIAITGTGSFITQSSGTFTNTLAIAGDITNAGTFDLSRGGTTLVCDITFNKNGNQTVSGAGVTTRFNEMTLNMGTSNANILTISSSNFAAPDGFVESSTPSFNRIQNGTLKLSGSFTYSGCPFISNGQDNTIVSTAGFWLNNANVTITAIADSYDINGLLRVTSGTFNVGTSSGNSLNFLNGSTITVEGGTINVAGRFCSSGNAGQYSTTFNQSGGTIVLCTVANEGTTRANLDFTNTSNSFTLSGGTIIIRHEAIVNGTDINFGAITSSISGGTIQLGDASSSVSFPNGFRLISAITLPDIVVYNVLVSATYPWLKFSGNATLGGILTAQSNTTVDVNTRTVTVAGTSTILGTLTTSTGTYDANGIFDASSGNVTYTGAGSLNLGSTVTSIGTFTESTSTVSYDASGNQNIDSDTYYHLIINGSGTKTLAGALDVNGDLTISAGTLASTSTYDITVAGNWTNNGTAFTAASRTVTFDGGSNQAINGTTSTTFYNVDIASSGIEVILGINTTITNTLTLTSGKFSLFAYTLTIGTTSSNGSISGGSSTAYIKAYDNSGTIGSLKRYVNSNAAYSYPIGDASNYTPLTFTLTANGGLSSAYLTIYTKDVKVPGLSNDFTAYLDRYWNVTESGFTTPTYDITYTYVDADLVGSETGMLPIKKSGATWYKPTGSLFTSGTTQGTGSFNAGTNTLTWTGLSTFSGFGGVPDGAVTLPIELISFTGKKEGKNNELKWTTASELNNDFFTIEKTNDGITFEIVGTHNGAGNSTQVLDYLLTDYNVRPVINYYRLKQTDFDGKSTLSDLISIDNSVNESSKEIVMITNILGQEVNEHYRGLVVILYADGTSVKIIQ